MIVEDYLRPAAVKAQVISVDPQGQTLDLDGNIIKRFGFHVFRHSLCSFLMAEGENPAVIPGDSTAHSAGHDYVLRALQKEAKAGGAGPDAGSGSRRRTGANGS